MRIRIRIGWLALLAQWIGWQPVTQAQIDVTLVDSLVVHTTVFGLNGLDSLLRTGPNWTTSQYRSGYHYIPVEVLQSDSVNRLVWAEELPAKSSEITSFTIFWHSGCIDGSYNITVTPEQIYLHSGHDNPNPNYLYWAYPIKADAFQMLYRQLETNSLPWKKYQREQHLSFWDSACPPEYTEVPDEWTDSASAAFSIMCEEKRHEAVRKVMSELERLYGDKFVMVAALTEPLVPIPVGWSLGMIEMSLPHRLPIDKD